MPNKPVPAAGDAVPKSRSADEIISAFLDMEDAVCSLRHMTLILGAMLDDNLKDGETGAGTGSMKVWLSGEQVELLSFAWNDVIRRARVVQDAFYAAAHGEAVQ